MGEIKSGSIGQLVEYMFTELKIKCEPRPLGSEPVPEVGDRYISMPHRYPIDVREPHTLDWDDQPAFFLWKLIRMMPDQFKAPIFFLEYNGIVDGIAEWELKFVTLCLTDIMEGD